MSGAPQAGSFWRAFCFCLGLGAAGSLGLACKQTEPSPPPRSSATATVPKAPQVIPPQPKTAASVLYPGKQLRVVEDFEAEAEQQIDGKNYRDELSKIEAQLDGKGAAPSAAPSDSQAAKAPSAPSAPSAKAQPATKR